MRILIADDDRISRGFIEHALAGAGHEVVAVASGDDAWIELQKAEAPLLAVLDWIMPGIEGPEICRRARERDVQLPTYIILLTSRDSKNDTVTGLTAGADDYLTKPFNVEELRARVQVGVRLIELQQKLAAQVNELADALAHVKQLRGLLPMCAWCKKVRKDDAGYWESIEDYISEHSEAQFTHGMCPDCFERFDVSAKT